MNKVCETRLLIEDLTFTSEILSCAASWGTEVARHYSNFIETRSNDSDKAIVHSLYLLLRYAFLFVASSRRSVSCGAARKTSGALFIFSRAVFRAAP